MPNYAEPMGQAGRYLGGAAGGAGGAAAGAGGASILDRLGGMAGGALELLDRPRQAVWNLARSGGRALSGEGTWDDALAAVPGALGGLAAGGLAATGFGIPGSLLAGSVLGGVAQDAGHRSAQPTEEQASQGKQNPFEAMKVSELTKALGGDEDSFLQNMAVGAATDPLSYLGGFGGGKAGGQAGSQLGAKAGAAYGGRLENIARHMGPEYAGNPLSKIEALRASPEMQNMGLIQQLVANQHLDSLAAHPDLARIAGEIGPGMRPLGAGVEGLALGNDAGHVLRLAEPSPVISRKYGTSFEPHTPPPTRPDVAEVLQAQRSVPYPNPQGQAMRAEHLPFVQGLSDFEGSEAAFDPITRDLTNSLMNKGWDFADRHAGNVAWDANRKLVVPDAGAVIPFPRPGNMPQASYMPEMASQPGTALERWGLRRAGAPQATQSELAAALENPDFVRRARAESGPRTPDPLAQALFPHARSLIQDLPGIADPLAQRARMDAYRQGVQQVGLHTDEAAELEHYLAAMMNRELPTFRGPAPMAAQPPTASLPSVGGQESLSAILQRIAAQNPGMVR